MKTAKKERNYLCITRRISFVLEALFNTLPKSVGQKRIKRREKREAKGEKQKECGKNRQNKDERTEARKEKRRRELRERI